MAKPKANLSMTLRTVREQALRLSAARLLLIYLEQVLAILTTPARQELSPNVIIIDVVCPLLRFRACCHFKPGRVSRSRVLAPRILHSLSHSRNPTSEPLRSPSPPPKLFPNLDKGLHLLRRGDAAIDHPAVLVCPFVRVAHGPTLRWERL